MNKGRDMVLKVRGFFGEVGVELRRCAWPSRSELVESTIVVIISVILLAAFVGLSDGVVSMILRWILR
jgi:preprotein translocase subunit SecE